MTKPSIESVPVFYRPYIDRLASDNVLDALGEDFLTLRATFNKLTINQLNFAYDVEKWTLKQILLHLIDAERILSYRALRFSRGDRMELQGFDQDLYVLAPGLTSRSKKSMVDEFSLVRRSTVALFEGFTLDEIKREGIASGYLMSAQNIGYVIAGHALHHLSIIKERYLASPDFPK